MKFQAHPIFKFFLQSRRTMDVSVIGMTNMPEAKLAREAEICYATLALATDYDCWHASHDNVDVESVVKVMKKNISTAQKIILEVSKHLPDKDCGLKGTLKSAVFTSQDAITPEARERFRLLLGE